MTCRHVILDSEAWRWTPSITINKESLTFTTRMCVPFHDWLQAREQEKNFQFGTKKKTKNKVLKKKNKKKDSANKNQNTTLFGSFRYKIQWISPVKCGRQFFNRSWDKWSIDDLPDSLNGFLRPLWNVGNASRQPFFFLRQTKWNKRRNRTEKQNKGR